MRTIKFRAQRAFGREWLYGSLIQLVDGRFSIYTPDEHSSTNTPMINPNTIGQFTGLHDADGKEIYEGDILADARGYHHLVAYYEHEASFKMKYGNSYLAISNIWIEGCILRVIGNAYDNPELLTQQNNGSY